MILQADPEVSILGLTAELARAHRGRTNQCRPVAAGPANHSTVLGFDKGSIGEPQPFVSTQSP